MGPKRSTKQDDLNSEQATSQGKKPQETEQSNEAEEPVTLETQEMSSSAQVIDALQQNWEAESDSPLRHDSRDISTPASTSFLASIQTEHAALLDESARNSSVSNLIGSTPSSSFSHPSEDTAHVPSWGKLEPGRSSAPTSPNVVHDLEQAPMSTPAVMCTVPFSTEQTDTVPFPTTQTNTVPFPTTQTNQAAWPCRVFSTLCSKPFRWLFETVTVLTTWLVRELWELLRSSSFYCWLLFKKLVLWSVPAFLFFWWISCCWQVFYASICFQPGISQLTFCHSAYVPPARHETKINETFASANEKFAQVASNVSIMHAFPNLISDLQSTVLEKKAEIRRSSLSSEIFEELASELKRYSDHSYIVRPKLVNFNFEIYYDMAWILNKQEIIADRLHEISRDLQRKNLVDFVCCIVNRPTPQRRVSAVTRAEVSNHIQSLIERTRKSIETGEDLQSHLEILYTRLAKAQTVVQDAEISLDANRTAIIASRGFYRRLQNFWFSSSSSSPDTNDVEHHLQTLAQIHSVLFQGTQRINSTIDMYYEIEAELRHLRDNLVENKDWTENLSPDTLAKLVGVGTGRLRNEFEDWTRIEAEDRKVWEWEMGKRFRKGEEDVPMEYNFLTRKIEAGKDSNP